jgi:hypothetical protein
VSNDIARRLAVTQGSIDRSVPAKPTRRTLPANAKFHALLGEWAARSGQDATTLKHRVKDHLHEYTDAQVPNDPLTDNLLELVARVFLALGVPDLMRVLPSSRSVRFYHTSARWTKQKMAAAIDTIYLLAGQEGVVLDTSNWDRTA